MVAMATVLRGIPNLQDLDVAVESQDHKIEQGADALEPRSGSVVAMVAPLMGLASLAMSAQACERTVSHAIFLLLASAFLT